MKKRRNWVLPVITCVVVLAAALMPRFAAQWFDRQEMDKVHWEEMSTDSGLPVRFLTLQERLRLLCQWSTGEASEDMTMEQCAPEELDGMWEETLEEIGRFIDNTGLPVAAWSFEAAEIQGTRICLSDTGEPTNARFVLMEAYAGEDQASMTVIIDEASGRMASLSAEIHTKSDGISLMGYAEPVGWVFFDWLGVESVVEERNPFLASFFIPECDVVYTVSITADHFRIYPSEAR